MRTPLIAAASLVGLLVGLGASLPLARGDTPRSGTISVDEIKEGMKGYGLTVFKGSSPEKFDVEVIGVLHNFRPSQDLILVKTPHPRLNVTKNVRGMSGSPIYLDGRLAGAYAYSLSSFQAEPVAGVTPIAPMLTEMRRQSPPGFFPLEPLPVKKERPLVSSAHRFSGPPNGYDLTAHAKELAARIGGASSGVVPVATPLLTGGLTERAMAFAKTLFEPLGLEPLQGGGGAKAGAPIDPAAPKHYEDGGTLGVQLVRGDVSMMGLGTTTHVEGTRACGFGHPMMNAGDSALPTALAKVLWIYASDQHSFKVGEAIRPLGALVQDRQSAVVVDETKAAPTFPVHVAVDGVASAPRKDWNVEVAEDPFMSASLLATTLGSVVEATISDRRDLTWRLRSTLSIRGYGKLDLEDFGVAIGGLPEAGEWASARIVRALGAVMNNPWQPVHIDGVEATLDVKYARDLWRIRGVEVLDPIVDAGEPVRLRVRLQGFTGPEVSRSVEVRLPKDLAGRDVDLEVLPGYRAFVEVAAPENLRDLIVNESKQSEIPRSLVVQYRAPTQGVAFKGQIAPELPVFALDALRTANASAAPEAVWTQIRTVVPTDRYVDGRDKVRVRVRPVLR
ncbi:MAG: SpoIVB peptidase S55 domain-containing protein [Polyangiaceae bacterium]